MDNEQRCGTCKWFNQVGIDYGVCEVPIPAWLRKALVTLHEQVFPLDVSPGMLSIKAGKDCPTWHAK